LHVILRKPKSPVFVGQTDKGAGESVHAQFGDGAVVQSTLARRKAFRKSSALSDQAFVV
jgi:hypothetical protein